jgi:hypothetical protein
MARNPVAASITFSQHTNRELLIPKRAESPIAGDPGREEGARAYR